MTIPIKIISKQDFKSRPNQEAIWNSIAKPWKTYVVKTIPIVEEFLENKKGKIIDLGCGTGRNMIPNPNITYYGVDFSKGQLEQAEKHIKENKINAKLYKSQASNLEQFKDNKFESIFYETDKMMANSEYKKLYYLPKLKTKLDYCNQQYLQQNLENNEDVSYELEVLRNEINKELIIVGKEQFTRMDELTVENFNTDVYEATRKFLDGLEKYYTSVRNKGVSEKDRLVRKLNETPEKSEAFEKLRQDYQNEAIAALVKNVSESQRIVERHGKLIRKINPIYMRPVDQAGILDFRTQLYVAEKYFAGMYFPTVVFNLSIIWLMVFLLTLTLYYDLLRRLLTRKR